MKSAAILRRAGTAAALFGLAFCAPVAPPATDQTHALLGSLDLRARAGQLVVASAGSLPAGGVGGLEATLEELGIGGLLVHGVPAPRVSPPTASDTAAAFRLPMLVVAEAAAFVTGAEDDGGEGSGGTLAMDGQPERVRELGAALGRAAARRGVHLLLAPAPEPPLNTTALAALVEGVEETGTGLALRLFTPDLAPPTVDRAWIEATQGRMLDAAAAATGILPGAARLPALSADSLPVAISPSFLRGYLRRDRAWKGLVVVDLADVVASTGGGGSPAARFASAAVGAVAAGADLLLAGAHAREVAAELERAVSDGRIPRARLEEALGRVVRLKSRDHTAPDEAPEQEEELAAIAALNRRLAAAGSRAPPEDIPLLEPAAAAAAGMNEARLARADAAIQAALGAELFTSAGLAVVRNGRLVRLRGYGRTPPGAQGGAVDPRATLFDIASLTKVIGTTTAVALLVEEGRMELDAPVQRYVPAFAGERKAQVTVRHLLAHTSGLPPGLWLYGSARSPEQALEQVLRQPLRRPPAERAEYSDLGMILLAEAAEAAAGEPLDTYLARRLFAPLGMANTMFLPPLAFRDRVVPTALTNERGFVLQGVVHDANAFRLGGVTGHAGLFSTAYDVAVFGQMMLNGGGYGSARILQPQTVSRFVTRQRGAGTRALGWDTPADRSSAGRFLSARSFGHTGYTGTSLWIDPELSLVVVLLTNRTYDRGRPADILRLRVAVHEAVAQSITDRRVVARRGAR